MPANYRSRKARLAALSAQLRGQGKSWAEIARVIAQQENESPLVAMRLAHGLSQTQVAESLSALYPSETPVTTNVVSYWEVWPVGKGHQPSLITLSRLARLYECRVSDLVDDRRLAMMSGLKVPPAAETIPLPAPRAGEEVPEATQRVLPLSGTVLPAAVSMPEELVAVLRHCLAPFTSVPGGGTLSARQRDSLFTQLVNLLRRWAHTMDRRDALRLLGWAVTAAAAAPLTADASAEGERIWQAVEAPNRVDAKVIGHIEETLWLAKAQDDRLGPRAALDTVLAQRSLARALVADCPSDLRPRLLEVLASASRLAGWLSFDLSAFDDAEYYYEHARATAHEAEATELGAHILCNMSYLATWRGRPRLGIDHAVAAQGWARRTPNVPLQAYAADVAARAYAADGQHTECLNELDRAQNLIAAPNGEPGSIRLYYDAADDRCGDAFLVNIRGRCLLDLGCPADAAERLTTSLAMFDPTFMRNIAVANTDLALACVGLRDVDQAAEAIGRAAAVASQHSSVRVVDQVRKTRAALEPWKNTTAVRELDQRLAAYQVV